MHLSEADRQHRHRSDLVGQVMAMYCPFYDTFTTNPKDTKLKVKYYDLVRGMTEKELKEHIKTYDKQTFAHLQVN